MVDDVDLVVCFDLTMERNLMMVSRRELELCEFILVLAERLACVCDGVACGFRVAVPEGLSIGVWARRLCSASHAEVVCLLGPEVIDRLGESFAGQNVRVEESTKKLGEYLSMSHEINGARRKAGGAVPSQIAMGEVAKIFVSFLDVAGAGFVVEGETFWVRAKGLTFVVAPIGGTWVILGSKLAATGKCRQAGSVVCETFFDLLVAGKSLVDDLE